MNQPPSSSPSPPPPPPSRFDSGASSRYGSPGIVQSRRRHVPPPPRPDDVEVGNGRSTTARPSMTGGAESTMLHTAIPVDEEKHNDDPGRIEDKEQITNLEAHRIRAKAQKEAKARILATTTEVDLTYVDAGEERIKRQRNKFILLSLAFFVVVGAAVGIWFAVKNGSSQVDPANAPTSSVPPSPSPTVRPIIFTPPPTLIPGNGSEFEEPGIGSGRPDQNECEGAFPIDSVIGDVIFGQITDPAIVPLVDTCEVIGRNGVGVWYKVTPETNIRLSASTCGTGFDTQVAIFTGECNKLRCVAGNDQIQTCGSGSQSQVAFFAEAGFSYFIHVQARRSFSEIFRLEVTPLPDNDVCDGAVSLENYGRVRNVLGLGEFGSTRGATTDNLTCLGREPLGPGVWYKVEGSGNNMAVRLPARRRTNFGIGSGIFVFSGPDCSILTCVSPIGFWEPTAGEKYYIFVHGSVEGDFQVLVDDGTNEFGQIESLKCELAENRILPIGIPTIYDTTFQDITRFGSCGDLVFATGPQAWFVIVGTGSPLTVSTCGTLDLVSDEDGTVNNFDTQISIFLGTDCFDLRCVDGNDQACGDQSSVTFQSGFLESYLVAVHGFGERAGNFSILVEEHEIETSSECDTAINIVADGLTILGNTNFGEGTGFLNTSMIVPAPTSTTAGTGTISTQRRCVFGTHDDNDDMDDAILGPGVYYNVTGTGRRLTASTCGRTLSADGDFYDPKHIIVLSGSCSALQCRHDVQYTACGSSSNDNIAAATTSSVTWMSELGVSYLLFISENRVDDDDEEDNDFQLTVEETVLNDQCETAIGPILPDFSVSRGSTRSATSDDIDNDDGILLNLLLSFVGIMNATTTTATALTAASQSRNVWYTFIGDGRSFTAETCLEGNTKFETAVFVLHGRQQQREDDADEDEQSSLSLCNDLSIVSIPTAFLSQEPIASRTTCIVNFPTIQDEVYFIVITGQDPTQFGNYGLRIFPQRILA